MSARPDKAIVGIFDSGLGGLNVLARAVQHLPEVTFLYFGDTANNPYGDKSQGDVLAWTGACYQEFHRAGAQAMVIACNSATSAAVAPLRAYATMPVIGIEPALKTAIDQNTSAPIVVFATRMTIDGSKFRKLMARWPHKHEQVHPIACPGLADMIESSDLKQVGGYLERNLLPQTPAGAHIVLGCTHYGLVQSHFEQIFGAGHPIYDGAEGVARRLASFFPVSTTNSPGGQSDLASHRASSLPPTEVRLRFSKDSERKAQTAMAMLENAGARCTFQPW